MSTSGSKSNEHVAHFLVDIHNKGFHYRNGGFLKNGFAVSYPRTAGTRRPDYSIVPFRYRITTYDDPEEDALAPTVTMHIIDIDLSQLKVGDEIFCGFDKDLLEYNDGDERSLLYSCENEKQIMGLCAYDPYEWDLDNCCFQLKERTSKGFGYCIVSDPNQFDEKKNYQSKITSLAAAWLTKDEYNDADLVMNLALTCVIG